ncbi:SIR2 family NAD-dependent protein deacylase [Armatimonas rosea]|uniref:protein acetyllysine N-acetyltransferase n=1 Tax=Armatimonas rosea TaxID=685828 RepID=A0A7W9W5Q7_ARMRO|nr:NAD-dependent deacylase [Armatimonas rosea]MBB6048827.1 NAD-dependent deacetylase [Armatimonas rosea]
MNTISPLGIGTKYHRAVILTGAGVSVASGLPTYRGPGGLWENDELAKIVHAESIPTRLPELWKLYSERRATALSVGPNAAHLALAEAQKRWPGSVTVITQNVDNLHQRAGSENVIELHGSGLRTRCTQCNLPPFYDEASYDTLPLCPACGAPLRPDVVLFGETLPEQAIVQAAAALRGCDLFLVVGTSSVVIPAAYLLLDAYDAGAHCVSVNIEPSRHENPYLHDEFVGRAEELLPVLLAP